MNDDDDHFDPVIQFAQVMAQLSIAPQQQQYFEHMLDALSLSLSLNNRSKIHRFGKKLKMFNRQTRRKHFFIQKKSFFKLFFIM